MLIFYNIIVSSYLIEKEKEKMNIRGRTLLLIIPGFRVFGLWKGSEEWEMEKKKFDAFFLSNPKDRVLGMARIFKE